MIQEAFSLPCTSGYPDSYPGSISLSPWGGWTLAWSCLHTEAAVHSCARNPENTNLSLKMILNFGIISEVKFIKVKKVWRGSSIIFQQFTIAYLQEQHWYSYRSLKGINIESISHCKKHHLLPSVSMRKFFIFRDDADLMKYIRMINQWTLALGIILIKFYDIQNHIDLSMVRWYLMIG